MSDDNQRDLDSDKETDTNQAPAAEEPGEARGPDSFDAIGAAAELADILAAVEPGEPLEQHGESYTDILESEVAELGALLEARDAEVREARDELSRSLERVQREHERQLEQRTRELLLDFLEVLDNLDRALASAREVDHNPAVVEGVELVRKSFLGKLSRLRVTHDPSLGETFDPNLHDAMGVIPVSEPEQAGTVVAVLREGYLLGDTVLRPAGVIVGKKSE